MRWTKGFALAAIAAMAAMAFIGTSTAAAQHEVVLCKELVTLCPSGKLWPSKTVFLALAENPELLGNLNLQCEDSTVVGETTVAGGSSLSLSITSYAFGKLPTPTLGEGCKGCPLGELKVHVNGLPFKAEVTVATEDKYSLIVTGEASVLCGGFTCVYSAKNISTPITHTGKHASHSGTNLPTVEVLTTLTITSGSEFICGKTAVWHAKYVMYLAHIGASVGLAWPSLDTVIPDEVVLCKDLVEPTELCPEGEFYPSGTKLLALAANPEFKASPFGALKCEDSTIEAETTTSMGDALGIEIIKIAFGKLPTPTLGEGCTTCTKGVHPPPSISGSVEMTNEEDYVFKSSEAFELLSCFGLGVTCLYGSDGLVSLVDGDSGKHKEAAEEKGLAEILVSGTLSFIKGSNFCPETGIWTANYVVYALESEGKEAEGWLALYESLES